MATKIFSSKSKKPDVLYDAKILEACVEEAIIKAKLSKDAKLDNRDASKGCKTFVVATATMIPSPFDCTIMQACRATSAAPSFFDPMLINGTTFGEKTNLEDRESGTKQGGATSDMGGDLTLSDGGLTANNPTIEALLETARIPGWGRRFAAVVSIGTGKGTPPKLARSQGLLYKILGWFSQWQALRLDVAKYCADLVTDTEATHARVQQGLELFRIRNAYFRLNADDVGEFELDDLRNFSKMEDLTLAHILQSSAQKNAREKLAKSLRDPDYARDQMLNERYGVSGAGPTAEAIFVSSLALPAITQPMYGHAGTSGGITKTKIPWTWPVRNNGSPAMHSLIFYNYDEKMKSLWNHRGHDRRDQSVLTDRRDEGESAIAVLELMSELSFVSSRFVEQWKMKTHDMPEILRGKRIMINGTEVHCAKYVWLSFRCAGFGMKTQRTWFRVLDTDEVEVVLGYDAFDRSAFRVLQSNFNAPFL